jgi:capsular exopolysaccharide synthesis family protein
LNDVNAQLESPVQSQNGGNHALDLLPGLGVELTDIARIVEESSGKLAQLQDQGQTSVSIQSLLNLEVPQVQETAEDLDAIASNLQRIRQELEGIQQQTSSANQSPLGLEASRLERTSRELKSTAEQLRTIGGDVRGRNPLRIYSDIATQANNARATLEKVPSTMSGIQSNNIDTSRKLVSIEEYVESVAADLKNISTRVNEAATGAGLSDQDRILLRGQVVSYTVGLAAAGDDLKDIRTANILNIRDYGRIITAEGLFGTGITQLNTLAAALDNTASTNSLNKGITEVLTWVEESAQSLQAISQSFRGLEEAMGETRGAPDIPVQASLEIDNVSIILDSASVRLKGLRAVVTDLLLAAKLSSVESQVPSARNSVSSVSARLNAGSQSVSVTLADRVGVVQARVQSSAEGLWDTLENLQVATHVPSTVLESGAASRAYTETENVAQSLEIASRQLQGLLAGNADPLVDGELSILVDQLVGAQTEVRGIVLRLSEVAQDSSSLPSALIINQKRLETAARILREASAMHLDLTGSNDAIGQNIIEETKEQLEIGTAILTLVAQEIARFQTSETDALRYGQLVVLEQRLQEAASQTTNITTQLQQLQRGRGPQYLQLRQLQQQLELALLQPQDTGITLVDSAVLPQAGASSSIFSRLRLPLGAFAGFLLGSIAVLVRAQVDQSVRTTAQLRDQLGLTSLGVIPKGKTDGASQPPIVRSQCVSAFSEALQLIGTNLSGHITRGMHTFLITSTTAGEGKTMLGVNLAQVLAQYGRKVLLVDANLRKPDVARVLGLPEDVGLATALANQQSATDYIVETETFAVLPGGPPPANPVELLSSPAMTAFLKQAQQRYDVVLIDSPPAVGFAETKAIAKSAGGAILVVKGGAVSVDAARESKGQLEAAGVLLVGTVLNFAAAEDCAYLQHEGYGTCNGPKKRRSPLEILNWKS